MRSKIASRIFSETSEETKQNVRQQTEKLLKMTTLEQSIKNALPDLMELGVGQIIQIYDVKYELICIDEGFYDVKQLGKQKMFSFSINTPLKILGKPITLADVLRWMQTLGLNTIDLSEKIIQLLDLWDLWVENLSDQPQPVKDFLSNLIVK